MHSGRLREDCSRFGEVVVGFKKQRRGFRSVEMEGSGAEIQREREEFYSLGLVNTWNGLLGWVTTYNIWAFDPYRGRLRKSKLIWEH